MSNIIKKCVCALWGYMGLFRNMQEMGYRIYDSIVVINQMYI